MLNIQYKLYNTNCAIQIACRSTNIGTDIIVSSRRLRSISMHRTFLYHLQSHLGNFAHNIGQRIVLNHAIVSSITKSVLDHYVLVSGGGGRVSDVTRREGV